MKGNPAFAGRPLDEYADVVQRLRALDCVGFFSRPAKLTGADSCNEPMILRGITSRRVMDGSNYFSLQTDHANDTAHLLHDLP
jgi:hypothetical protein